MPSGYEGTLSHSDKYGHSQSASVPTLPLRGGRIVTMGSFQLGVAYAVHEGLESAAAISRHLRPAAARP